MLLKNKNALLDWEHGRVHKFVYRFSHTSVELRFYLLYIIDLRTMAMFIDYYPPLIKVYHWQLLPL